MGRGFLKLCFVQVFIVLLVLILQVTVMHYLAYAKLLS